MPACSSTKIDIVMTKHQSLVFLVVKMMDIIQVPGSKTIIGNVNTCTDIHNKTKPVILVDGRVQSQDCSYS